MRIELLRDLDPYAEALRRLRGEPEPIIDRATADAIGLFTLSAPESGLYRLRFAAPGHATVDHRLLPVVESIELDAVPHPESAERVTLLVLDADGKPIVSPHVSNVVDLDRRNRFTDGRPGAFTRWRAGGAIEVYAERGSKAALDISAPGHETHRVAVARIGAEPIRLARRAGAIERRIVVVEARGGAVADAVLVDRQANPIVAATADGSARCVLAPGETIHVLLADGRTATWTAGEAADARVVISAPAAITGMVVGHDDRPLAGAWVGASVRWRGNEAPTALTPRAVATDGAGRYVLTVQPESELSAWAAAPGHVSQWRDTRVTDTTPRRALDFHLDANAILEGVVVDGEGTAIAGAEIRIQSRGSLAMTMTGSRAFAGEHGRSRDGGRFSLTLPPSTLVELATSAPGFAPHRTETQTKPPGQRSDLVIALGRGASLVGRVVDDSGAPVPGAKASLEITPKNAPTLPYGEPSLTATATGEGRFAFDHLPADLYDLAVTAPGYSAHRRPGVAVSDTGIDLGDVVLGQGESLVGRVLDESGNPIAGAVVKWDAASTNNSSPARGAAMVMVFRMRELDEKDGGVRTDGEGRFTLTDLSAGQAIDLYADAEGYGLTRTARLVLPVEDEVEIRLKRAGSLTGRIVDRSGEPVQTSVSLDRGTRNRGFSTAGERSSVFGVSDDGGSFAVEDLTPGEWRLEVRAQSYERFERTVSVIAGESTAIDDVVLDREETAEVRGTVTDSRGGGVRAVVRSFGSAYLREVQTDPNGVYLLPAVPVGETRLSARRLAGGAERIVPVVVVEGENTVDFTLEGVTAEGHVVDSEGNGVAGVSVQLSSQGSAAMGMTGHEGGFTFHDLAPGRYWTFANKPGMTAREQLLLDLGPEGESGIEIVMTRGAVITGRILGVPQRQLGGVSVMAFGMSEAGARVLADGTYRVDGVAPGEWTIAGHSSDFREVRKTITIAPDQSTATLDLDFSGPGFSLRGHVGGPEGPIQDGWVLLRDIAEGRDSVPSTSWTDYQGEFRFGPLARGTYLLEAYTETNRSAPFATRILTIEEDAEVFLNAPPAP